MQVINNLLQLLLYSVRNLYAVEEQISQFVPFLIEKANHNSLKNALKHHAGLTEEQKQRLTQIVSLINQAM